MAILSKIRERSMFLIVIIGLALFAFVASPKDIMDFFNASKLKSVGSVDGETISSRDFALRVEAYKNSANRSVSDLRAVEAVWKQVLSEKMYKKQLTKAGIVVGEKDVWDAVLQIPSIQNAPLFQNEIGLFDEDKFKAYLADLKEDASENASNAWSNWLETERSVQSNLERKAYTQLVRLGVNASLSEGERSYFETQTKLSGSYVFVSFSSIHDSLVDVGVADVKAYISAHESEFKTEASRDLQYVNFDITASPEDELAIKDEVAELSKDLEAAKNEADFFEENDSDLPLENRYFFENDLPGNIKGLIFNAKGSAVVGPYAFQNHYRISKVLDFRMLPDSVKASHILIPYKGSRAADASITRTAEAAKKMADSLLSIVRKQKSQFSKLAKQLSSDTSSAKKGGDLGWFSYGQMVPEFRDYAFLNKKGSLGVVETIFGFHLININNRKNLQKAVKLATFGRKIMASEATENAIFEKAETLAYELSKGRSFEEITKENKYLVRKLEGIKPMEENIAALGKNRSIVRWAFNSNTKIGDSKRFDLEKGYAVVVLTNSAEKGLQSPAKAASIVKPILVNSMKADLIAEKMKGDDLASIAKTFATSVQQFSGVSINAPTLSGIGTEPAVVGAMYGLGQNSFTRNVVGKKGVFALLVTEKEIPEVLPSYKGPKEVLKQAHQRSVSQDLDGALKALSVIEDNRSELY